MQTTTQMGIGLHIIRIMKSVFYPRIPKSTVAALWNGIE